MCLCGVLMSGERRREKERGGEAWEGMRRGWTRVKVEAKGEGEKSGRTGEERVRGRAQEGGGRESRSQ